MADALTMASTPLLVPPPPPPSYKYWGAKWSPDGSRIAFFNNYGDTFIANWDGSIVQQLGRYGSVSNEQPAWSPSGDRIVVDKWDSSTQQSDLWSISVTDANLAVNLTNTPGVSEGYPVWSPRGDLIAYSRGGVWVMNADGTNQREIRASAGHPSWSPDGKRIVFYLASDGDSEIYTIDLDSGNLVKLTNNFEADYNPAWSPDGKSIAFSSSRAGGLDIYVMNSDGSNPVNVTNTAIWNEHQVYWSSDSAMLAIDASSGSARDIFVMNRDGSNPRRLNIGLRVELPDWRP